MDDDDEETEPGASEFTSIPFSERLILQSYHTYTPQQQIKPEVQRRQTETEQKKQVSKARKRCTVIEIE